MFSLMESDGNKVNGVEWTNWMDKNVRDIHTIRVQKIWLRGACFSIYIRKLPKNVVCEVFTQYKLLENGNWVKPGG